MPLQVYTTLKSHEKDKSKYQSLHVIQTLSSLCTPASHEQVGIQVQEEATSTTHHFMAPQGASLGAESSAKQGRKRKGKEEREAEGREGTRESGREDASLMGVWNSAWRGASCKPPNTALLCSLTCSLTSKEERPDSHLAYHVWVHQSMKRSQFSKKTKATRHREKEEGWSPLSLPSMPGTQVKYI